MGYFYIGGGGEAVDLTGLKEAIESVHGSVDEVDGKLTMQQLINGVYTIPNEWYGKPLSAPVRDTAVFPTNFNATDVVNIKLEVI